MLLTCCKSSDTKLVNNATNGDTSVNLYAFIGEKISVKQYIAIPNNKTDISTSSNSKFVSCQNGVPQNLYEVKYKILKNVFNEYITDADSILTYKSYRYPEFKKHNTVILYFSKTNSGSYYYQGFYDVVHKNSKGIWLGKNGKSPQQLLEEKLNHLNPAIP